MELIDTHCHLDFDSFDNDREVVLDRAQRAGVLRVVNPGIDLNASQAAVTLAQVHPKQYQAVTCVKIHNQSSEMLEFERINVPVTYLSLYNDEHNHLWTQNVSLVWTEDTLMAQLDIEDSPPAHLGKAQRISGPREEIDRRLLVRAFNALFS